MYFGSTLEIIKQKTLKLRMYYLDNQINFFKLTKFSMKTYIYDSFRTLHEEFQKSNNYRLGT